MATNFPLELPEFEPTKRIGSGGFGEVWLARQPNLDRDVAIKIGHAPLNNTAVKRRFERECIALGRLSSNNGIVDVYSSGISDDGLPYLIMEYIEGGSVADRLGQLDENTLRKVGIQLCSALSAAHSLDIFHRDLKPANVFMRSDGDAVVGDFGIARLGDGNNTTTNQVVASVAYAAPEILDGSQPSTAADIYGIGVTLASVLIGRSPFSSGENDTVSSIIQRVVSGRHENLGVQGVSPSFSAILERTLSVDPAQRPSSAAELGEMLVSDPATTPASTRSKNWSPADAETRFTPEATSTPTVPARTPPHPNSQRVPVPSSPNVAHTPRAFRSTPNYVEPSSNKTLIGILVGAGLIVVGVGLFFMLRNGDTTQPSSISPAGETTLATSAVPSTTSPASVTSTTTEEATERAPVEQTTVSTATNRVDATEVTSDVEIRVSQRVRFAPGTSSASIEGGVILAERDVYTLEAQAGQEMLVELSSIENNATFTLVAPDNTILTTEALTERVTLPLDGDYRVVIAPSRGNATYSVNFAIE